jgi:hypothetical protein
MIYVTTSQLVEEILDVYNISALHRYMIVIIKALKKYNTLFTYHTYTGTDIDLKEIFWLVQILQLYNKYTIIDLQKILSYVSKKNNKICPIYEIKTNSIKLNETIAWHIQHNNEKNEIESEITQDVGVFIKGGWMIYKRNLQSDLQKLLH